MKKIKILSILFTLLLSFVSCEEDDDSSLASISFNKGDVFSSQPSRVIDKSFTSETGNETTTNTSVTITREGINKITFISTNEVKIETTELKETTETVTEVIEEGKEAVITTKTSEKIISEAVTFEGRYNIFGRTIALEVFEGVFEEGEEDTVTNYRIRGIKSGNKLTLGFDYNIIGGMNAEFTDVLTKE